MIPFKIPDRYKYANKRFAGGQGFVSLYRDTYLNRYVAIKFMKSVVDAALLKKELSALRELRTRHVVEVYDLLIAKRSDAAALVQEYVPGPNLKDYSIELHSEEDYLKTLWQLSCGLSDIHAKNKVHRDIKPSNVKFDGEGILKILDFGLVSELPEDDETVNARGTRPFLGPELYGNPPMKIRPSLDVYAFGVTAWYLLGRGNVPKALREDPPQSDSSVPSFGTAKVTLPSEIVSILDQTLDVSPSKRPKMLAVRDTLQRQLLFGRHRLTLSVGGRKKVLDSPGNSATLREGSTILTIGYDGLSFAVGRVEGDVYINNQVASVGTRVSGSCVITMGAASLEHNRTFVAVNLSNPEVVL